MRKKRMIILSVILSVLTVLIILSSTLFTLQKIKVDFTVSGMKVLSEDNAEGIVKAGKFQTGRNIFFMSFSDEIKRIEKAYPYVKVINIERKFPNKAVVHVSEREPAFWIVKNSKVYCFDEDLKVLNTVYSLSDLMEMEKDVPQLVGVELEVADAGVFISNKTIKSQIVSIIDGFYAIDKRQMNLFESITITQADSIQSPGKKIAIFSFVLDESDLTLEIRGESELKEKMMNGTSAYFKQLGIDLNSVGKIVVGENKSPQYDEA